MTTHNVEYTLTANNIIQCDKNKDLTINTGDEIKFTVYCNDGSDLWCGLIFADSAKNPFGTKSIIEKLEPEKGSTCFLAHFTKTVTQKVPPGGSKVTDHYSVVFSSSPIYVKDPDFDMDPP